MTELVFIECDPHTLIAQIGVGNILSVSGGRVIGRPTGIDLPVSNGYRVTVDLAANDTYVVRRVFKRGDKEWIKGERREVYCEEVGDAAYYAGMFRSHPDPEDWGADEVVEVQAQVCQWYAGCTNDAAGEVRHPIIGMVPTCQRCADKHELTMEVK